MKKISFQCVTLTAIAVCLVTEGVLRWSVGLGDPPLARLDPVTEYELVGPAVYSRWGNKIAINSDGMRAPGIASHPSLNDRRILLIGDSVVYGGHFIDQSETIATHMTRQLAEAPHLSGCAPNVLPVAVSSWGPVNQAAFLKRSGVFQADAAGIVVSAHDLVDVPQGASHILPYRTKTPFSAIGDAAQAVLERLLPNAIGAPAKSYEERARASLAALDDMAAQLGAHGIETTLFYHPTMTERAGALRQEVQVFQTWAAQNSVRFINLGQTSIGPSDYRDNIHPTARGAATLAAALAQSVVDMVPPCAP